jgi:hypothetical protein
VLTTTRGGGRAIVDDDEEEEEAWTCTVVAMADIEEDDRDDADVAFTCTVVAANVDEDELDEEADEDEDEDEGRWGCTGDELLIADEREDISASSIGELAFVVAAIESIDCVANIVELIVLTGVDRVLVPSEGSRA